MLKQKIIVEHEIIVELSGCEFVRDRRWWTPYLGTSRQHR